MNGLVLYHSQQLKEEKDKFTFIPFNDELKFNDDFEYEAAPIDAYFKSLDDLIKEQNRNNIYNFCKNNNLETDLVV